VLSVPVELVGRLIGEISGRMQLTARDGNVCARHPTGGELAFICRAHPEAMSSRLRPDVPDRFVPSIRLHSAALSKRIAHRVR
jgi:hypothetical protein